MARLPHDTIEERPVKDAANITLSIALDAYQAGLAIDGDRRAFELLYRRWHPKGLRLAQRLLRNPDEARDVMQDAALTISRDIRKLKDPARFSAWAYTIVRRRAADHIDRAVKRRHADEQLATTQTSTVETSDTEIELKRALAKLAEADRLMLTLFYVDGFQGREIATALGLPLGTVKSRLFTARKRLKHIYSPSNISIHKETRHE